MTERKGKGGRPRLNADVKASYLNMRVTPELRARVEASAKNHNVPMVQEVERLVRAALEAEAA